MRLLIIIFIISIGQCFGQTRPSSLEILESDTAAIQTKINSLTSILNLQKYKLPDSLVVSYYEQLSDLSSENRAYDNAIFYLDTILNEYKRIGFFQIKKIEEKKALKYKDAGNTDIAISMLLDLLAEYEDRKALKESAALNNRIGIIFKKMQELENAKFHLNESVSQARKINDHKMEASSLMTLGNCFKMENDFDEAKKYYKKSIELCEEYDLKRTLAGNYNNYGSLQRMMKNPELAMKYYKKAVDINLEIGNDKWLSYNYNNLGILYKNKKLYAQAIKYFNLSREIKESLGDTRSNVQTMLNLSEIYEAMGNTAEAYSYHKLYSKLQDSVYKMDRLEQSKVLAAEFQSERREAEIIQLNMNDKLNQQELEAKDERIKYQSSITWLFGTGIVLVLGIAFTLWRSVVTRKKTNQELEIKNHQIDEKNTEIIDSINYAKRIQNTILPNEDVLQELLPHHALFYKPKDIISGDFYICEEVNNNIFFGTVDCTGHGVPGAMVSIVASNSFSKMIHEMNLVAPGKILDELAVDVPHKLDSQNHDVQDGMDMAICRIDKNQSNLSFAGAYQNCWLFNTKESILGRNIADKNIVMHDCDKGILLELKGNRRGIGMGSGKENFHQIDVPLVKGDKIMLSTDGFQDQFGGVNNKKFKVKQMRDLVLANMDLGPNQILSQLTTELQEWQGKEEQVDDICVMIVEL